MWEIFLRTIKDRKISLIIYIVASVGFMWMYIAMFPSMQDQAANFQELMKSYPQEFLKAFNIEELSFDKIEKFLAMEDFSIIWPLMVMFMMISVAGGVLAGEIEKGTAEIILSKPVSRLRIFFGKYLAGMFILAVFTACSVFFVAPLCTLHNVDYVMENYVRMAAIGFLFGLAVFSLAIMFSAFFSERSKPYMFSGGILVLMYVANIVANLKDQLKNFKYLSFFHYYDQNQALIHNTIETNSIIVFAGVAVFCTVIGAIYFSKRDIAV
jgi:ABC-2 type transport system permease protein